MYEIHINTTVQCGIRCKFILFVYLFRGFQSVGSLPQRNDLSSFEKDFKRVVDEN
jgi:hypothetical protein